MHGKENAIEFKGESGKIKHTIGGYVSVIYQSIRNGDLYQVLVEVAKDIQATTKPSVPHL
jgi:phenylalanine ammonia-lyase